MFQVEDTENVTAIILFLSFAWLVEAINMEIGMLVGEETKRI
jgi:hypothetical protein